MGETVERTGGRRQRLFLEALEERIAPAGNVVVVVSGGNLTITGDDANNEIEIDADGLADGQVRISSGADTTTINEGTGPVIVGGVTGNAKIRLGDGLDEVYISEIAFDKSVSIDLGTGDGRAVVGKGTFIAGSLSISAKDGGHDVDIAGEVGGKTSVKLGGGGEPDENIVSLYADFGDDVKIVFGKSRDTVEGIEAQLSGDLAITGGGRELNVVLEDYTIIVGNVTIQNAQENVRVATDHCSMNGGFQLVVGNGGTSIELMDSSVMGPLSVKGGIGDDRFVANGSTLAGSIKLQHGQGESIVGFASCFVGSGFPGAHAHDVFVNNTKGSASFDVQGGHFDANNVTLNYGKGVAIVQLIGADIEKNFSLKNTEGQVWAGIYNSDVAGKMTISTGIDRDFIYLDGMHVGGATSIATGKGDDGVSIDFESPPGNTSTFDGKVSILTGDGVDGVYIGQEGVAGNKAVFNSTVALNGGKGDGDTLYYVFNGNTFAVDPKIKDFENII
jgi:hypothetical protein